MNAKTLSYFVACFVHNLLKTYIIEQVSLFHRVPELGFKDVGQGFGVNK